MSEDTFLVLIPAHNEERVIGNTLKFIKNLDFPEDKFDVFVIADNCTDNTCRIVKERGFYCLNKNDGSPKGKAYVLNWFLKNFKEIDRYDRIVILDADTLIDRNFLKIVSRHKETIIQGFVMPLFNKESIIQSLSGYSELLSQVISDELKSKLDWSVVLRGTGMVLNLDIFKKYIPLLKTYIEDTELSLLMVKDGHRIKFVKEAVVFDPKPANISYTSSQRTRWLYGQKEILKYYLKDMLKIMFSGIGNFFFVSSIIFKPKTLFYILKLLLLITFLIFRIPFRQVFIILLSILIFIDILYYLIGIFVVTYKKHYLKVLFFAPLYIFIWLKSFMKSLSKNKKWTRAR